MPRINSLKIRKLGNVAPGTELKFGPRGAVLLGRNGTGKTTLLNLLTDLCRCDLDSISGSDYEVEFSQTCIGNIELHVTASCDRIEAKQEAQHIMQKLLTYVPHYCVEAWTYYNLPVLEGICRSRSGARDDSTLAAWKAAPSEIEEAEQP